MSHAAVVIDEPGPQVSASVDVLTAEVKAVVIGKRQVTMSVYKQLDTAPVEDLEPWGRVRAGKFKRDHEGIEVIGRRRGGGDLVRSAAPNPGWSAAISCGVPNGTEADYFRFARSYTDHRFRILTRDELTAYVEFRGGGDQDWIGDGWTYRTAEARDELESWAEECISEALTARESYRRLAALPLIVLAGLR